MDTEYLIRKLKESNLFAECPCGGEFKLSQAILFDGTKSFPLKALEVQKKLKEELKGLIRRGIIHFDDSIYYEKLIKELKNLLESEKFDRAMGLNPIIRRNPHLSNSENKERRKEEVK